MSDETKGKKIARNYRALLESTLDSRMSRPYKPTYHQRFVPHESDRRDPIYCRDNPKWVIAYNPKD